MDLFHRHLAEQVTDALRRGIAVVVDPAAAFGPFFDDLTASVAQSAEHPATCEITVNGTRARFARFDGSWFALREAVEPFTGGDDRPEPPVLLYVPAPLPSDTHNVLMELWSIGGQLTWDFEREARACLRRKFTDGIIDEVLEGGRATYDDVVLFLGQDRQVSRLKLIFGDLPELDLLVRWLAEDRDDEAIAQKGAVDELYRLVGSKLGLLLAADVPLAQARARMARYVLINEFRHDLEGEAPSSLATVEAPGRDEHRAHTLAIAQGFRAKHPEPYVVRADQVEQEFRLAHCKVPPDRLGRIDTFRFEERLLLDWTARLLEDRRYADAQAVVLARESSFWVERPDGSQGLPRKEQWELCRRVAELGLRVAAVAGELPGPSAGPEVWVQGYAAPDGWHRVDTAQRSLETWRAQMSDESVCERAVGVALREHERLLQEMATGFARALATAGWSVPRVLHQTRVHPDVVARSGGPVAWFVVDAMRYEMGAELARLLDGVDDLYLQPAIAALPSITEIGMAALLPGASGSFSVEAHKGRLAAVVDGAHLCNLADRRKYLLSRVPDSADMTLGHALQDRQSELKKRVAGKSLIVVRSQEIDLFGESGDDLGARRAMAEVLGDIARAVRRLSRAGVEHFVVTADHGHLFGLRKGDDMKTDAPGGDTLDLHRRCWIGRGGTTPPGTRRVTAGELGYASDLELVFPTGLGVFKAGGDLSFHHGSTSLQELVIPVLSFRVPSGEAPTGAGGFEVRLTAVPDKVTNRVFIVTVEATSSELFRNDALPVRVVLLSEHEQVGHAGMASGAELDRDRGVLHVKHAAPAHVGMNLQRDTIDALRVVVLDPDSGAALATSASIPVSLLR